MRQGACPKRLIRGTKRRLKSLEYMTCISHSDMTPPLINSLMIPKRYVLGKTKAKRSNGFNSTCLSFLVKQLTLCLLVMKRIV
ncbi:hypothetical protein GE061_003295 [Apolygus lucorum]|uniref:Uncharacterized protein n=1 Tax=Apolygus lucorum TaxID=248454 RepID=A0A8S9X3E4_APOLU|nr:hypothetical protein GE061_003295 [Apolygus lucorum]